MADAVRAYGRGVPNYRGARIPVSSHFNLTAWESYLKAYDDKIVVDFLKFGWPINCDTTVLPKSTLKNHGSAAGANGQLILSTYICKELSYHSVCGPYHCNPFNTDCVISPLQCVPKRDSPEPRIVHDLSFPPDASVNSCIPSDSFLNEPYKLQLPGIDRLVSFVNQLGRGCHVFKKDLKRAYRQIPVDPADYHLLGMCIDGLFYFHTTLPFGLRSATIACQRTTKAAAFILNNHGIMADVYIDDFYGAAQPTSSHHAFTCMNRLFSELGLQASPEKDTPPSCEMTCLGVQINTASMVLTVPQFRLQELQEELSSWSTKTSCTRKDLQRLLGKLAFVTSCVRPGRAFMCRLINTLKHAPLNCKSRTKIPDDVRSDLQWWMFFLQHFNGVSVIPTDIVVSNPHLFATDACLTGCGAVCFGEFFHCKFPDDILQQRLHINQLELLTVVVAVKTWHSKLQGLTLELLVDNEATVHAINNQRSKDLFMQNCLRELWLCLAINNINLRARYVEGSANSFADALSRLHLGSEFATRVSSVLAGQDFCEIALSDSVFHFTIL